jgi:hypothetical protein
MLAGGGYVYDVNTWHYEVKEPGLLGAGSLWGGSGPLGSESRAMESLARWADSMQGRTPGYCGGGCVLSSRGAFQATRPLSARPDWQLLSPTVERGRVRRLSPLRVRWQTRALGLGLVRLEADRARLTAEAELAGRVPSGRTTGELERAVAGHRAIADWALGRERYALARVRALATQLSPRLRACGTTVRHIRCDCHRRTVHAKCRQRWVCYECRVDWTRRTSRKLCAALSGHLEAELRRENPPTLLAAQRRNGAIVVLITASVRQVGPIAERRQRIRDAWSAVRKYVQRSTGRSWPYALVWEMTEGSEGNGNLHVHIAAVWPWVDWARVVETWRRSVGDMAAHCRIMRAKGNGKGAAVYLSKYMAKGVEMAGFSDELAADFLAAQYNQRGVTTSHRFWAPPRKCCRYCGGNIRWERRVDRWAVAVTMDRQREVLEAFGKGNTQCTTISMTTEPTTPCSTG